MTHRNAPLNVEGRRRLVQRCKTRPIAHVAAEMGISRRCAGEWVARYREHGEAGLEDRSSAPKTHPTQLPPETVTRIVELRKKKYSARRIVRELADEGVTVSESTVSRWLRRLGLNQLRHLDVDGEPLRAPGKITARYPGHMVHMDIKKVGRIPDGGGWRVHGKDSAQARRAENAKTSGVRAGYTYLHSVLDGYSRLAWTEPMPDETAASAVAVLSRARVYFAAHGITRITRVVTDNGSCFRAKAFTRCVLSFAATHQRIKPYTPKHNGKVERYQGLLSVECLYAHPWTSEEHRSRGIGTWNFHYNYHRPHTAIGDRPPAAKLKTGVTNVMTRYS